MLVARFGPGNSGCNLFGCRSRSSFPPCSAPRPTVRAPSPSRARPSGPCSSSLVERYPGLRDNLLDASGGLHKFVNVYKDDDDIRYLDGLDTKLADGDVLSILPAVAGGA